MHMLINIYLCYRFDLKAGPLAIENYYVFSELLYKPYAKLGFFTVGFLSALLYIDILKYRQTPDENKPQNFKLLHYIHNKPFIGYTMTIIGICAIITAMFCGYVALKSPYDWSQAKNYVYFALVKISNVFGVMLIFFSIQIGHFRSAKIALNNSFFRAMGRLTFYGNLIIPIVMLYLYCDQESAVYLTIIEGCIFGAAHVMIIMIVSLIMHCLIG